MKTDPPIRCPHHYWSLSRRQFVGITAGLALGARFSTARAQSGNPHTDAQPRPIPGGATPFGVLVHHNPVPAPGAPLSTLADPSEITDFNGFVGLNRIRGAGIGTGFPALAFQADMGFMVGEYVAMDGKHYHASFGFIWMDIYNGPVGSANISQQIHDYNPHITPNGLFWTIPVRPDSVEVHLGAGQASFRLSTSVFDDHDLKSSLGVSPFPAGFPQAAEVSFDVEWSGILEQEHIRNEAMNFEGDFLHTGTTIQWTAKDLPSGFEFTSEPPDPARAFYGVIGHERNGVFFA